MSKINDWIDDSVSLHWLMFVGSIMFGVLIFQLKHNLFAVAFCVGASLVFFPPMQKSIKAIMKQDIAPKYFMRMGNIMLIIAMFAQVGH